ncbi:hypothetical protein [Paracoccus indicus]|uniref:hypothetical protein n=1 Tax=Paracoccus indicus TaxID=2079229 RepID=UPI001B8AFD3B|nr:hypothetical protein [Paracoccus indicus]
MGLRAILSASLNAPVRVPQRDEAGAAMMAAVAIRSYPDMDAYIAEWVTPLLDPPKAPDPAPAQIYDRLFPAFAADMDRPRPHRVARTGVPDKWHQ